MLFLKQLILHQNTRPSTPAIISDQVTLTYAQLVVLIQQGVAYLQKKGIKEGQVVGLSIADEVSHLLASLSLLAIGCRQITLASYETDIVKLNLASRAQTSVVITNSQTIQIDGVEFLSWPDVTELATQSEVHKYFSGEQQGVLYLITTGTSGESNIIPMTEEQISLQAQRHVDYTNERFLRFASVEYNTSKRHRLYSLWNGGTNIFRPQGSVASIVDFVLNHRISCLDISRMHVSELIALNKPNLLANIKIRPGGSEVPAETRKLFMERVTPQLYVRYATTETGGIAMACPNDHGETANCGKPLSGVVIEIVNDKDEPLPCHAIGEIRVKTAGMATSYLDNPKRTAQRFRNGWFYPGDAGYLSEDGKLTVKSRIDDMINLNGINIFPYEIEHVLEQHPAVRLVAALPLASTVHGQIPVAVVEVRFGCNVTEQELVIFARERLTLRYPRRVIILDKIPVNNQGKLLRNELKQLFSKSLRE